TRVVLRALSFDQRTKVQQAVGLAPPLGEAIYHQHREVAGMAALEAQKIDMVRSALAQVDGAVLVADAAEASADERTAAKEAIEKARAKALAMLPEDIDPDALAEWSWDVHCARRRQAYMNGLTDTERAALEAYVQWKAQLDAGYRLLGWVATLYVDAAGQERRAEGAAFLDMAQHADAAHIAAEVAHFIQLMSVAGVQVGKSSAPPSGGTTRTRAAGGSAPANGRGGANASRGAQGSTPKTRRSKKKKGGGSSPGTKSARRRPGKPPKTSGTHAPRRPSPPHGCGP
ncbi:MAG: hypothetical protein KC620_21475, partial [Myxococcales bacterium]|nr:hypothetical protein [Myxococcales bacterium]